MTASLIEIFRAGKQRSAAGEEITFSAGDLAITAASYSPSKKAAPLVLGHPADDGPALGLVLGLKPQGGRLFALVEPAPSLVHLVRSGAFKKISSAFFRPSDPANPVRGAWYLRHVGFFGSAPVSVKGMADPAFNECGIPDICFSERMESALCSLPPGFSADPSRLKIHLAAKRYQESNPSISYMEAVAFAEEFQ